MFFFYGFCRAIMAVKHHANVNGLAVVVEGLVALEARVRQILITHVLALD